MSAVYGKWRSCILTTPLSLLVSETARSPLALRLFECRKKVVWTWYGSLTSLGTVEPLMANVSDPSLKS